MSNFPPLRIAVLSALVDIKDNMDKLDESPYDEDVKALLRKLLAPVVVESVVTKEVAVTGQRGRPSKDIQLSAEDQSKLLKDIKDTLAGLDQMLLVNMETKDKIQVAKTKTGLLEQLLKMVERHTTAQKVEAFKEEVIKILEDLVEEKDREIFLRRMEAFR
jgi:predicted ArsR family transcriptional regulator